MYAKRWRCDKLFFYLFVDRPIYLSTKSKKSAIFLNALKTVHVRRYGIID